MYASKYSTPPAGYSFHFVLNVPGFFAPGVDEMTYSPFMFSPVNFCWARQDERPRRYGIEERTIIVGSSPGRPYYFC